jgi:Tn3 transposase DDE domain
MKWSKAIFIRRMPLGKTEAIFATSHLTGFSYAPRFKNLKRQRLYIFRSRQSVDRSAWKIKPAAYCDEQHIIQFWDDILRFIATIKLKETTASDIFRRLNSYSKQHGLYHASKAFGQILKSIFILRVIDEPVLLMSIEKVLSGIEHVHAFTRAVSVVNPREFLQAMAHGSAAAWGHLNLLGEYDFLGGQASGFGRNQDPKTDRLNQVPSWEFRNRRKSFAPRQLARILWDFAYLCRANTRYLLRIETSNQKAGMSRG